MQITIDARFMHAPIAEAVDAENDDLRVIQLFKTIDRIPDVLNIAFRKPPIQIVRYDGDQRMVVLLGTSVPKLYDHIPVDFRVCAVEDLS